MLTLFLSVKIAFAQTGKFYGTVTDEAGIPLPEVKITMFDAERNKKITFRTDKKGKFFMTIDYPTTYQITFELKGYLPISKSMKVRIFKPNVLNVTMANLNHFKEGNYKAAIESFKQVIKNSPDCFDAFHYLGISYFMNDDTDNAINSFKKAKEINLENVMVYISLAKCYVKNGLMDKAEEAFSQAIKLRPDNAEIYNIIGTVYYKYDKIEEAIAAFQKSLQLDPLLSSTYYRLGCTYLKKRDVEKSLANFERFLELEPNDPIAPWIKDAVEKLKKLRNKENKYRK